MNTPEQRLDAIEARNARVERDKTWETSCVRRASIAVITYMTACLTFLFVLPQAHWYLAALVPVFGYLLSTLSLPKIRALWERTKE